MIKLSTEQMLYLLYAFAYLEDGSVRQGVVNEHLPANIKKKGDKICDFLCSSQLLEVPKKRRVSLTEQGKQALIDGLRTTDYIFESSKGKKVLNAILDCLKSIPHQDNISLWSEDEMDFDTFVFKLKELYLQIRKQQELQGVIAIRSKDICQKFIDNNSISQSLWDKYFAILKSSGQIFAVMEKDEEIIQWGSK